jgi:hypothetical protein
MDDWKRIPECPDEGMCLQKVIRKCWFWGTDGHANFYVISKPEQQRSTAVDQILASSNRQFCLDYGRSQLCSGTRNREWSAGSTLRETDVRLRERQAGYLCLGDSYDLTLQASRMGPLLSGGSCYEQLTIVRLQRMPSGRRRS